MLVSCTRPSIIQMGQYVGGIPSPPQKNNQHAIRHHIYSSSDTDFDHIKQCKSVPNVNSRTETSGYDFR
jgi:hypothetical protein